MHIYEYLFAGLIIVSVLTASIIMVSTISVPASNASQKDQLKVTAEKIMTQMLLDTGFPYDWDTKSNPPSVFGLAQYGQTSRQAYELDPDKVQRLMPSIGGDTSYYVQPTGASQSAVKLLNLGTDYGFTLEIKETLHVTPPKQIGQEEDYEIKVTSAYGLPVIGAQVSAALYYIDNTHSTINRIDLPNSPVATSDDGKCTLKFGSAVTSAKALAVTVNYYGQKEAKVYPVSQVISATLFQNKIVPDQSQPYSVKGEAKEVIVTDSKSDYYQIGEFKVSSNDPSGTFALEPSAVAILAISNDKLLLANRDLTVTYQTINFQDPAVKSASFSCSLERTVVISQTTYTATLYFWRMNL